MRALAGAGWLAAAALADERPTDFNRDIRPILARNCFACHGPDEEARRAGLRLDDREAAGATLASGSRAIVPGRPGDSELVARINATDPDVTMPPPGSNRVLAPREKLLLERWIAHGATAARHWAYVPPRRHGLPPVDDESWPVTWIDRFVLERLEAEGLEPVAEADPVTLLRRVTFDLTGLPPSPAELDAHLADTGPDRHERLVDRLLASSRHAERLAAWWLDLVRYADSVGYHGDQPHSVSPYRDWVIEAFLDDLPFDRFTMLQLAGDMVEPTADEHPDDPTLAGGYNRLLQTTHEGGLQSGEYREIYQADRIRNLSSVWLGATVGCAQCHDHKYDPFTARDFHALGAFFADVDDETHLSNGGFGKQNLNSLPTIRSPEIDVVGPFDRARAAALDAEIRGIEERLPPLVLPPRAQPPEPEPEPIVADRLRRAALETQRRALERKLMVTRRLAEPRPVRIRPRGDWMDDSGPLVEPAIPAFLGTLAPSAGTRLTRTDLARWLTTPTADGGIGEFTARVTVNRLWAMFFGSGLCRSLGDFGAQGEPPDHPALLDELALEFMDHGWGIRDLIRTIVTSRSYRMSSAASPALLARDPDNRLLARQGRWRLPAEHVRDTALAVGGLLVERLGGASVHPYQPAGHYRHLNFPQREYRPDDDDRQWRRGLYVHWQRMFLHPQLAAFDAPTREECTAERTRSNTPQAALVLLNDPTFVEAARKLAELAMRTADGDDARIDLLWRRTLSRMPDAAERRVVGGLLERGRNGYRADPRAAEALLDVGIAPREPTLDPVEIAAWTTAARAVLNLHEAIARY